MTTENKFLLCDSYRIYVYYLVVTATYRWQHVDQIVFYIYFCNCVLSAAPWVGVGVVEGEAVQTKGQGVFWPTNIAGPHPPLPVAPPPARPLPHPARSTLLL